MKGAELVLLTLPRRIYDALLVYSGGGMFVNKVVCEMAAEGLEQYGRQPLPPLPDSVEGKRACCGIWMLLELTAGLKSLAQPIRPISKHN